MDEQANDDGAGGDADAEYTFVVAVMVVSFIVDVASPWLNCLSNPGGSGGGSEPRRGGGITGTVALTGASDGASTGDRVDDVFM